MKEWDSDDEDNGGQVSLGLTQKQGLGKSLPLPHNSFPGGVVGGKYLPSSCSVLYHTVFNDQYSGAPATDKFTTSFMTNSSGGASFDSMALFRTGE